MLDIKKHLNVPNVLSAYRLLTFPVMIYLVFAQHEKLFVVFFIVNLVTDILDGFIARRFNLTTEFGAKLDSYADISMYISALIGVIVFKSSYFAPHIVSLSVFIFMFFVTLIFSYVKFGKIASLHLYSSKLSTLLLGLFFLYLFTFGFDTVFYYIVLSWGMISYIEQLIVLILVSEPRTNVRGLYWVLKDRHSAGE